MWEQYRKTFWGMQAAIWFFALAVLVWTRLWTSAATFFLTMQIGAVSGAMWGARLKAVVRRRAASTGSRT